MFEYNSENTGINIRYVDFPKKFVWNGKKWKVRKASFDTIGRVHSMNPAAGDVFYLRMLLHHDHCAGKISFQDLKTIDGTVQETYQEVCMKLGLLQDDREWDNVLTEGAVTKMCPALRELFTTILLFCMPSNPKKLFDDHYLEWADDFILQAKKKGVVLTEEQLKTLILIDLKARLQSQERHLKGYGLHEPSKVEINEVCFNNEKSIPVLIKEELNFDIRELNEEVELK